MPTWRRELETVFDTLDYAFPGAVRGVYLHGSRAENAALSDSDVDLTIMVHDAVGMARVRSAIDNRRLPGGQRIDAHVDTVQMLANPNYAFITAGLMYASNLIRGEDIRELVPDPDYAHFRRWVLNQARKGIAMLRDKDNVNPPVDYPDPALPYDGYTVVRKPEWYPPNTNNGTKELVAVATYCASAWVVTHAKRWLTSKVQAVSAIREIENSTRAALVERLFQLCRIQNRGRVPTSTEGQAELTALCQEFLGFENEILDLANE